MKTKPFLILLTAFSLTISCSDDHEENPVGTPRPTMNKQDSLAIVAYYHSMKCAEWKGYHWDLKDYTTWGSISVTLDEAKNEYRVTKIETPWAPNCIPAGYSLPPELGNLTKLETLMVWGDRGAVGGIPPEIFNCPLKVLYVVDCEKPHGGFSGTIPKEIGKVANTLEELCISNTSIGGEIPEEVGTLNNLRIRADLSGNNFTGKVPLFLRNLPDGTLLIRNYFTEMDWRYFTEDIGVVPNFGENHLTGEIPDEVLKTERWKHFRLNIANQKEGYGYDRKYFK